MQATQAEGGGDDAEVLPLSKAGKTADVYYLYHARSAPTLFTPALVAKIQAWEQEFVDSAAYGALCQRNTTTDRCLAPMSVFRSKAARAFDDSAMAGLSQVDGSMTQEEIDEVLDEYASMKRDVPAMEGLVSLFFVRGFGAVGSSSIDSPFARTYFPMGAPLPGYNSEEDRPEEQDKEFVDLMLPIADGINLDLEDSDIDLVFFNSRIIQAEFDRTTLTDLYWAGLSIAFVFLIMSFHMRSFFLGGVGIAMILVTVPVTLFLYRLVFRVSFFQSIHTLTIFIILGVGGDNLFLFFDAWNQAPKSLDMRGRVEYAWFRSTPAMLVTSGTTVAAFLSNGTSTIMPIATFGYFAATLIAFNLTIDIFFYPAIIVFWERSLRHRDLCGCRRFAAWVGLNRVFRTGDVADVTRDNTRANASIGDKTPSAAGATAKAGEREEGGPDALEPATPATIEVGTAPTPSAVPAHARGSATEYSATAMSADTPTVASGVSRQGLVVGPDGAGSESDVGSPGLKRATSSAHIRSMLSEKTHAIERFFHDTWIRIVHFGRWPIVLVFLTLFVLAGVKAGTLRPLSKQEQWFPDSHFIGKALNWLDNDFGVTERDSTVKVTLTWGVVGIDRTGTDKYDPSDRGRPIFDAAFDPSSPEAQQFLSDTCDAAQAVEGAKRIENCWIQDFASWRREALGPSAFPVRASGPNANDPAVQRAAFNQAVDEFVSETLVGSDERSNARLGLRTDGSVGLISFVVLTNLETFLPYDTNLPVYERWEAFVAERNAAAPAGVNRAVQTAGIAWTWMQTERSFVSNALSGMGISIAVAFCFLIVATRNFIVGFFATLSVVGIVAWVLGIMALLGWELGTTESISCVILIGFSVDYVVHIAVHYIESVKVTRYEKTQEALGDMGISIVSGSSTSIGSALFLFPATIIFFEKFAILFVSTISFSVVWALVFYPALMLIVGPEHNLGSIASVYRAILRCFQRGGADAGAKGAAETAAATKPAIELVSPAVSPQAV